MFQINVHDQKSSRKRTKVIFLKKILNGMIRTIPNVNIKIHHYFYIIKFSKFMEPNKCIDYKCIYLNVSYDF